MENNKYYSVGSSTDIVVSNSSLNWIDPLKKGHPKKFLDGLDGKLDDFDGPNLSLERGNLIHAYVENKEQFIIEDLVKPSEGISLLMEEFSKLYIQLEIDNDLVLENTSELLNTYVDYVDYKKLTESVYKHTQVSIQEIRHIIYCITKAREITKYDKRLLIPTFIRKIINEGIEYFHFLFDAKGKIIMTTATKEIVENVIKSLESNNLVNKWIFPEKYLDKERFTVYKELPIYFTYRGISSKSKLDILIIDTKTDIAYVPDLKTYGLGSIFGKFLPNEIKDIDNNKTDGSAVGNYRLHRQCALYQEAVKFQFPKIKEVKSLLIPVETTGYYECAVIHVSSPYIHLGILELNALYDRIKYHKENGFDYSREVMEQKIIKL